MALNNISEGTRRSIVDIFSVSKISWAGRLREDDFLARLYDLTDLTKMGSTDYRIPNAKGDIVQHRVHLMLGRERYIPTRNAWISGSLNQRVQGHSQGQKTIPAVAGGRLSTSRSRLSTSWNLTGVVHGVAGQDGLLTGGESGDFRFPGHLRTYRAPFQVAGLERGLLRGRATGRLGTGCDGLRSFWDIGVVSVPIRMAWAGHFDPGLGLHALVFTLRS